MLLRIIPQRLFQPLAAPGAQIYLAILLELFTQTKAHQEPLSRDFAANLIYEQIASPDKFTLTADAADDQEANSEDTALARASAILRYLEHCGWLRVETQNDFTQTYILPDYAFRILRTLQEIEANEPPPLAGLICAIHDLLRAALDDDPEVRLPEAHRQTQHLINSLKELQHNIGLHINQLLEQQTTQAVLEQLLLHYRSEIVDKAYHQLRTTDHVSRFRPGVIETATRLGQSDRISVAAQRLKRNSPESVETLASHLRTQLQEINDLFESLDRLLQSIDARHSQFVDSAVRAVEMQLSAHSTTSGQLHSILTQLLGDSSNEEFAFVQHHLNLHRLELIDSESLALPSRSNQPFTQTTTGNAATADAAEIAAARDATQRQLERAIGRDKIRRLARRLLRGRQSLRATEVPLETPDDLALIIYLRTYGDGSLGYRVSDIPDSPLVEQDGFAFRDFWITEDP
jgi:Family of unknown function (DUF5716)